MIVEYFVSEWDYRSSTGAMVVEITTCASTESARVTSASWRGISVLPIFVFDTFYADRKIQFINKLNIHQVSLLLLCRLRNLGRIKE
jgi:hypothetical protein